MHLDTSGTQPPWDVWSVLCRPNVHLSVNQANNSRTGSSPLSDGILSWQNLMTAKPSNGPLFSMVLRDVQFVAP